MALASFFPFAVFVDFEVFGRPTSFADGARKFNLPFRSHRQSLLRLMPQLNESSLADERGVVKQKYRGKSGRDMQNAMSERRKQTIVIM